MTDPLYSQRSKKKFDRYPSPSIDENDRYTPPAYEDTNKKKPDAYSKGTKNNRKPSSPRIDSPYIPSNIRPELYHLKTPEHNYSPNDHDSRASPGLMSNNRVSPMPFQSPVDRKPAAYHLKSDNDHNRRSPSINDTYHPDKFIGGRKYDDDNDHGKVTVYYLTNGNEENRENLPVSVKRRSPSPPIVTRRRPEPVSYDIDDDDKYAAPTKRNESPPLATSIHHIPHSRASQSITRSINKFRFGGY